MAPADQIQAPPGEQFPALSALADLSHQFVLRVPGVSVNVDRHEAVTLLRPHHEAVVKSMGFLPSQWHEAEQIHDANIAVVNPESETQFWEGADGLITKQPGILLGIMVADCCAVYLVDPENKALGLVHAGRKGAELGITGKAIRQMQEHFGTNPSRVIVQLSPCIRPPDYEVDFAALIRQDCLDAGIKPSDLHDCGLSTAQSPGKYYSYRLEKGKTGRMLALLGLPIPHVAP